MRKFSKSILTAGLLSPLSVFALGIGDISTNSGLNQVLRAEIPLVGSQSEDPSNIRVGLASPAAFAKAGLDRPFFLSTLKFEPVLSRDGLITVRVTSEDRIKEPFVNFLLEVEWPKGTTMREFTILLDPPVTMRSQTPPIATTSAAPPASKSSPVAASASYARSNKTAIAQALPENYGPVKKNDNLWRIAGKLIASNDITREQMMLALYDENPQAFYKQNVNALKRGALLKVPEHERIVSRSPNQATREFKEQNRIWASSSKSASTPESANLTDASAVSSSSSTQVAEKVSKEPQAQLKLLTPKEADAETKDIPVEGGSVDTLIGSSDPSTQANMAMEMAATLEQENKEFQTRLAALESQVEQLQSKITIKDAQLAQLQTNKPSPQNNKAIPQPTETEESSLPWYLGGGLAVLLLAGLLGRRRSKDQVLPEPQTATTQKDDKAPAQPAQNDVLPVSSSDSIDVEESTLLSEFSASEFDELTDPDAAADPLTEADVYIAYGRYQQAEDLMLTALQDEPDNHDYQLKLLDIFFAAGKSAEFESFANDHRAYQHKDPELWSQIKTMGQELCPESEIFADLSDIKNDLSDAELNIHDEDTPMVLNTDEIVDSELAAFENAIETSKLASTVEDNDKITPEENSPKDDFEFDFDLIQPGEEKPVDGADEDISEEDEVTTKLALVEAYIDMEDLEAARETLNEILQIGNEEQKVSAQKMLDNL